MQNVNELLEKDFHMEFDYCIPKTTDIHLLLNKGDIEGAKKLLLDEINRQYLEKNYMLQKYQEMVLRFNNKILKEKDVKCYMSYHMLREFAFLDVVLEIVFREDTTRVLVKNMIKDEETREQVYLEDYLELLYKTMEQQEKEQKSFKSKIKNIIFKDGV